MRDKPIIGVGQGNVHEAQARPLARQT